jgi:hypothetical protein
MGLFSFFGSRPPSTAKIGYWLFKNDQDAAVGMYQALTSELYDKLISTKAIDETGPFNEDEIQFISGHVCNLLNGYSTVPDYQKKPLTPDMDIAAETVCQDVVASRTGELFALAQASLATVAIWLWFRHQYFESYVVTHIGIGRDPEKASELYRIRGLVELTLNKFQDARNDLEVARNIDPGLVFLNEPLEVAIKLAAAHKT